MTTNFTPTAPHWPFFFEKWYFDAQSVDSTLIIGCLATVRLFGLSGAELLVLVSTPKETTKRSFHISGGSINVQKNRTSASFSCGELSIQKDQADDIVLPAKV